MKDIVGTISSPAIVCHGGAGHSAKDQPGVDAAVEAGWDILQSGGTALDATLASVVMMENDPALNAGTGGRIRSDGSVQLDAAVMTSNGQFGAITCIQQTKNPILVAAKLLDENVNILAGTGAREFADKIGVNRATISHILSGRNKPSIDFLEKLLHVYPELNANWLITGIGYMKTKKEDKKVLLTKKIGKVVVFYDDNSFDEVNS